MLNALRHLRFGQLKACPSSTGFLDMLNALRHLRFGQGLITALTHLAINAQRLTASKVWADLTQPQWDSLVGRCSTPYSI